MQAMNLSSVDRERITDCVLEIQSVQKSLSHLEQDSIPEHHAIQQCLQTADRHLRITLGYLRAEITSEP